MKNIEIKFRLGVDEFDLFNTRIHSMAAELIWERNQQDTFFPVPDGWLKLREEEDAVPVLISYKRSTTKTEVRASEFFLLNISDAKKATDLLSHVLSPVKILRKRRKFFMWKHTKIHLDFVEGVGPCLEFETKVVAITEEEAKEECKLVITTLQLSDYTPITVPYVDLLP